ncbi:class I adenylate-forming enzyme family protein [Tuberibacillus sp. Marseille-P3662]|uniref:class I adenylate-forming enzyme family protein n=1 Tax=Tuberibacillus sp. Marseille-P3662 TaxID=1965358 RepID=UPI000A1C9DD5|nr:class I adenylate-forming enzyme family protein [Tuberibacillus sp. Marseille-P3662]
MFDFNGRTLTDARAQSFLDQGVWTEESFIDVLEHNVERYPELIHKDEKQSLSYKELWDEVEAVSAHFYDLGLRKGDRIALQLPNTLDYVIAIFGAARIGAVGVTLQIDLGRQAIIQSLEKSQAKAWIIADSFRGESLYKMAQEIQQEVPGLTHLILQGDASQAPEKTLTFASLRTPTRQLAQSELETNRPGPLDAFLIVFTSGTTGEPKGVVHLHANYLWAARAYADNFEYQPGEGVLDVAPISHQTGMLAGVMMTIAKCGSILLLDRFSATRVLNWIERDKPAYIIGAPPHVIHVANNPKLTSTDTSSVKLFIYAGASVPNAVLQNLQTEGGIKVGAMFGWSEGFVATATRPNDSLEAISSTVGFAVPGIEVRLVDDDGHDVEQGTPGEMWSRGPNFSPGYFENPEAADRQWDKDGWFHSGDLLREDENGRYSFVARADDIINRGGTKVDPKHVEDAIAEHDSVETIAVVGTPHETLGQQVVACVVLKEEAASFDLTELNDFLAESGLAKFQFPDDLKLMDALPTTHSGKIKKKDLRETLQ